MSEEFEVKGPHEEVLEGNEESRGFNGSLAVMTAVMATVGAILSYEASVTLGEAIIFKNEASIQKTNASGASVSGGITENQRRLAMAFRCAREMW